MDDTPRRLRADAARNRRRLIAAASAMFAERGLEVGVGDIAERAGVGRGTLFRNFPSKEALVVAVVVERINESTARGRARLLDEDATAALFGLLDDLRIRQAEDRALFEALAGTWMAHPEIHAAHNAMLAVIDQLLARAQTQGGVRPDVSGVDMLLVIKGVCEVQRSFPNASDEMSQRQIDLVKAAIAQRPDLVPLRGTPPTAADLDRALDGACAAAATGVGLPPRPEPAAR